MALEQADEVRPKSNAKHCAPGTNLTGNVFDSGMTAGICYRPRARDAIPSTELAYGATAGESCS
eukprot:2333409-Rhodomonas_salina.2